MDTLETILLLLSFLFFFSNYSKAVFKIQACYSPKERKFFCISDFTEGLEKKYCILGLN